MSRFSLVVLLFICAPLFAGDYNEYMRAVEHPDRPEADFSQDARRKPIEVLEYSEIESGQIIIELGAGGGYTTELLAHVAGPEGKVYGHTLRPQRLEGGRLPNVVALERHMLYQLPDVLHKAGFEDGTADRIIAFYTLHDMYLNEKIDTQRLYKALLRFLKPGGLFIVFDNSAVIGTGLEDTRLYHRIDETFLREKIVSAGFEYVAISDLLRNGADDRKNRWSSPPDYQRGFHDRFGLKFRKPN
ncbi:MAG: methyltransferase domain-containing protein [Gammaproteobacteria bacterium]|nr:methyltransferase domain-containing protein [Gammaproteobacteria bacterium]